ncbi:2-hydroxychromene-2-carboxylate isomerase [Nannocystaceae bacterium ST9]
MPAPIEFWFDFISPYAYLAWTQIAGLAERHGRALELRPVLFASLLDHWGQLGPAEIPPKRIHTFKQVLRRAHDLGVPLSAPPAHPFNPLLGLRLASLELPEAQRRALIDRLYRAVWAGGPGISDSAVVAGLLSEIGLDAAALMTAANAPETKQRLLAGKHDAIARGVFGVPTMIVDGELFWGVDDLGNLERFLRGEDPIDPAALERWRDLPAQAVRERVATPPSRG